MEQTIETKDAANKAPWPGLSAWLWKPWYAKLWWLMAVTTWLVALFAPKTLVPPDGTFALVLTLIFHPFALFWYVAIRALWVWRQQVVFPWDPGYTDESADGDHTDELYSGDGIGFHRPIPMSYMSDPTDIRSPLNPANPAYIVRHRHN
ncbi:hypothetical protein PX699_22710 [Sphingobium sp. H39-3-25]|uniref:hypothetical protein n=1 Tax=Sphingomonadales TaxID=204457 RepID=UPI0008299323|nr:MULTISPECIES: hypothetical protein [Sphingomonadaceae]MDF0491100.1 hypothetical protein [Sphingomonas pollutisoli]MDF0545169.1 hypothetical protein [Sphingobium arseniciresistens]